VGNVTLTARSLSDEVNCASRAAGLSIFATRLVITTAPSCSTTLPSSPRNWSFVWLGATPSTAS